MQRMSAWRPWLWLLVLLLFGLILPGPMATTARAEAFVIGFDGGTHSFAETDDVRGKSIIRGEDVEAGHSTYDGLLLMGLVAEWYPHANWGLGLRTWSGSVGDTSCDTAIGIPFLFAYEFSSPCHVVALDMVLLTGQWIMATPERLVRPMLTLGLGRADYRSRIHNAPEPLLEAPPEATTSGLAVMADISLDVGREGIGLRIGAAWLATDLGTSHDLSLDASGTLLHGSIRYEFR